MNNQIEDQLNALFAVVKLLHKLIEDEEYEQFKQQQELLSSNLEELLDGSSQEALIFNLEALKKLEAEIEILQEKSQTCMVQLKDRSLKQKRTSNKLKAYK